MNMPNGGLGLCYLAGFALGELGLMFWWSMQQPRVTTPRDYYREKWAEAGFSACISLATCMWWVEGGAVRLPWIKDNMTWAGGAEQNTVSLGSSVVAGLIFTMFANGIMYKVRDKWFPVRKEAP